MSTHRSNGFLILALLALVVLQLAKAQSDVYQYQQQQQQPQQQPLKRQGPSQYCGKLLSHTLQLVCKGHYNKPLYKKSGQEMDTEDWNEWSNDDSYPFRSRSNAMAMITGRFGAGRFRRESRGVHDECCVKPCSLEELLSYCG